METFALLQASIVAVSSESRSVVSGKPAEKRISIFRPGTERRFFARLRTASNMVRAPKSASALLIEDMPEEAIMTGDARAALWPLVSMFGFFTPLTAAVSSWALVVKFCLTIKLPPKSTTAIRRSGPAPFSINFVAAARAWI